MAKRNVANLNVALTANTSRFTRNMTRAQTPVRRFASVVASSSARVLRFTKVIAGLGIAAAGTTAFIAGRLVRSGLQSVDAMAKVADKLGETTENLSGLAFAASLSGNDFKKLELGLQRMTRRVAEAAQGAGEAQGALEELGLDPAALSAKSPVNQFLEIADAMEDVRTSSDKVRLAFKLFDSEGVNLLNTLQGGSVAIREQMREAERLGLTFSRLDAAKVEQANDAITKLKSLFTATGQILAIEFSPFITAAADKLTSMATTGEGLGEKVFNAIERVTMGMAAFMDTITQAPALVMEFATGFVVGLSQIEMKLIEASPLVDEFVGGFTIGLLDIEDKMRGLARALITPVSVTMRIVGLMAKGIQALFQITAAKIVKVIADIQPAIEKSHDRLVSLLNLLPGIDLPKSDGFDFKAIQKGFEDSAKETVDSIGPMLERFSPDTMRGVADKARSKRRGFAEEFANAHDDTVRGVRAGVGGALAESKAFWDAFIASMDEATIDLQKRGTQWSDNVKDFFSDIRKRADEAAKKSVQQTEVFEELGEKTLDAADAQDKLNESIRSMPGVGEFAQVEGGSIAINDRTTRIKPGVISEQPLISDGADAAVSRVGQTATGSSASRESQGVGKSAASLLTQTNTILTEIRELLRTPRVPVLG